MDLKFKKLDDRAVIPHRGSAGAAGIDLTAIDRILEWDETGGKLYSIVSYDTGLAVEIPDGYVGLLFPRSSVYKKPLRLANSVGVIDSDYRGPIKFKYDLHSATDLEQAYAVGDRVGQLVILPIPYFRVVEVDELSSTDRDLGGFGSTGV